MCIDLQWQNKEEKERHINERVDWDTTWLLVMGTENRLYTGAVFLTGQYRKSCHFQMADVGLDQGEER